MMPKFRAWDKELQCWCPYRIYSLNELGDDVVEFMYVAQEVWFTNKESGNNFILMQSTGLEDKNGVEIFEGDIVEYFHTPAVIERVKGGFAILNTKAYEYTTDLNGHMRILGNIYKNPELMEVME